MVVVVEEEAVLVGGVNSRSVGGSNSSSSGNSSGNDGHSGRNIFMQYLFL